MKVFATADVHLGMKFSTFDDAGAELAAARFRALERCIETANREACQIFIVAGDLFDRQNKVRQTSIDGAARHTGIFCLLFGLYHRHPTGALNRF